MNPVKKKVRHTIEGDAVVDVILRDGSTLSLSPPARDDAEALVRFFAELSDQSFYLRFHGHPLIDAHLVKPDLEPDWSKRGALLGSAAGEATMANGVVALASYARLREREAAEVAFAVADGYRGRGVGMRLLEQLAARAAELGIKRFVAEVMAQNEPMLRVFSKAGFSVVADAHRRRSRGDVPDRCDRRVRRPSRRARPYRRRRLAAAILRCGFGGGARRVAAAQHDGGELFFRNILAGDFTGAAYPVNRNGETVAGVGGYESIDAIPNPVDLAVICVPATAVLEAAQAALRKGARALIVIRPASPKTAQGTERQRELLAVVREAGIRLIGPNCLGVASAGTRMNATFARDRLGRSRRVLVAKRRARAGHARGRRGARPRNVGVRLGREQGRCRVERSARVVGRTTPEPRWCCSISSRSGTLVVCRARTPPRAPETDHRREERDAATAARAASAPSSALAGSATAVDAPSANPE